MIKALFLVVLFAGSLTLDSKTFKGSHLLPPIIRGSDSHEVLLLNTIQSKNVDVANFNECAEDAGWRRQRKNCIILQGSKRDCSIGFCAACKVKGKRRSRLCLKAARPIVKNFSSVGGEVVKPIRHNASWSNIAHHYNFDVFRWGGTIIPYGNLNLRSVLSVNKSRNAIDCNISTHLRLPDFFGGSYGVISGPYRLTSSLEGCPQKPHGPSAHAEGKKAKNHHCPLCPPVPKNDAGVLVRLFTAIGGAASIMFVAGFVSWGNDRWLSRWWLYGGLIGGLLLSGLWLYFWLGFIFLSV